MVAHVRLAREGDIPDICDIYSPIVRETSRSFELKPPTERDMRQRLVKTLERMPWLSCEINDVVRGYAYANPHRVRAAYQWSVEVSVYIDDQHRQLGIGRALYTSLFALLRVQGFFNAYAGISLPNEAGIALHRSLDFQEVGTYRAVAYKHHAWHDVSWWQLDLQPHTPDPQPPALFETIQGTTAWEEAMQAGGRFLKVP